MIAEASPVLSIKLRISIGNVDQPFQAGTPNVSMRGEVSMWSIHCPNCDRVTEMLTINEACAFMEISRRTIYNWMESGALHVCRNAGGHPLICSSSLLVPHNNRPHDWASAHQL